MIVHRLALSFRRLLDQPQKVFIMCMAFMVTSIFVNGTLWKLWGMHRDEDRILAEIGSTRQDINRLDGQLRQAKDPSFIERQARDRLDLVGEKDLVFVFPDP